MPQSPNSTILDHSMGIQDPRIPCPNRPKPASEDCVDAPLNSILPSVKYFQGLVPEAQGMAVGEGTCWEPPFLLLSGAPQTLGGRDGEGEAHFHGESSSLTGQEPAEAKEREMAWRGW